MASIAKLVVSLGANTGQFQTDMQRASRLSKRELAKMERQAEQLNRQWNRNFQLAGAAVAAGLAVATKAAMDFEKAMAEVSTLVDQSPEGMRKLGDSVKKMSVQFGQVPTEQARALYQIISAGASDATTQMEQLEAANKLAVGGVTDVATAADGLTTVLNAYAGSGMSASDVSDILFTTMRNGKTTIGELSQSVGNVATIAAQTGVTFDQLGAAIGTLTKSGINTTQAMDALRGVLSAVLKQSDQSVKMAEELGVAFSASALEAKGLHGFLADIAATGATSEQLSKLFGRVEGLNAVMALGAQNGKEFTSQLESMGNAAGATDVAVSKMADQTAFKVDQARAAFEQLKIEMGSKFLASVSNLAVKFVENIDSIVLAVELLVKLLTVRLAVGGVRAMLSATQAARGMAVAFAFLGGPIGAVTLAVSGLMFGLDALYKRRMKELDFVKVMPGLLAAEAEAYERLGKAIDETLKANLQTKMAQMRSELTRVATRMAEIRKLLDSPTTWRRQAKMKELEELELHARNLSSTLGRYAKALMGVTKNEEAAAVVAVSLSDAIEEAQPTLAKANELYQDAADSVDALAAAHEKAVRAYQNRQALNRINAAYEEFYQTIDELIDGMEQVGDESSLMASAIDEGVRILERTFNDMWSGFMSGADDAFDGVFDGFKSLLANLAHQATTQKIVLQFQEAFSQGGGGFSSIDWKQMGKDAAVFASIIGGTQLGGGGQYAQAGASTGAAIGSIFGPWWGVVGALAGGYMGGQADQDGFWSEHGGSFLHSIGGSSLVNFVDTLGNMGSGVWSLFGGATNVGDTILRKLLGIERPAVAKFGTMIGTSKSDTDSRFITAFGELLISTRRLEPGQINDIANAIEEFDKSIAALIDGDTIAAITKDLESWGMKLEGAEITLENIIGSRLDVVLNNISDSIAEFVRRGVDTEDQLGRLQVGLSLDKILDEFSGIFAGRELTDLLNAVEGYKTAGKTIGEAFEIFLTVLDAVVPAMASLREYADSSLADDFAALVYDANISLEEAVAGMQSAIFDAIAAFDGSPEQLTNISNLVMIAREGELKLLAQIDAIQQGINANLDTLEAKIRGLTEGPKTAEEIFREANALFADIQTATTSSELADIERRFTALINSLTEEDQLALQTPLLNMIEGFREAINFALEGFKSDAEDNGQATRDLVDIFLNDIGDPLDVLANSNQSVADSLDNIDDSIEELGPTLANAISRGFGNANVNVTVLIDGQNRLVNA